jgi:F420 biosynthesis protein FbiB-like protein
MDVEDAIAGRRSVRKFAAGPLPDETVRRLIQLACAAPAPHGSRPWRFVHVASAEARNHLAEAMTDAWSADLDREGRSLAESERSLARSRRQIAKAPTLLLACLSLDEARHWPDERRSLAERDMFVQSLGAALQNLLLAAHARGLTGYIKGAPLFCHEAVARALDLPAGWEPAFLVLLGSPAEEARPPARPPFPLDIHLIER